MTAQNRAANVVGDRVRRALNAADFVFPPHRPVGRPSAGRLAADCWGGVTGHRRGGGRLAFLGLLLSLQWSLGACGPEDGALAGGATQESPAVSDLPHAYGRTFTSLDDYLKHLERGRETDGPSYREIRPGVYEVVPNFQGEAPPPGWRPQIYTRQQLLEKYGFER